MSDQLQFVAGVALVETHDKLTLVGHFRRRMKTGSPTDEMCQLMVDPLGPFIRWKIVFVGIAYRPKHATKNENSVRSNDFSRWPPEERLKSSLRTYFRRSIASEVEHG
jgi:hypothetical protein